MYATNSAVQLNRTAPGSGPRLSVLQIGKFYPPERGGMESHLQTLSEELRGHVDLSALVSHVQNRTVQDQVNTVNVTRLARLGVLAGASLCPSLPRHIRQAADADIVHLHVPNPTAVVAYLASRHKGRLVVTYHSDLVRQRLLGPAFEPVQQALLRRADAIIVGSPNYLETSRSLRDHQDRCHVVPLGIRRQHPPVPASAIHRLREQYGERIVLGVGRLVYYKGFDVLIDAMREVDAHLLLVGVGPLRDALSEQIRTDDLTRKVTLLGAVSDAELQACYAASDVFVLPSVTRTEAFGLVQVEAMAAGVPVINTNLDSGVPFVSLHEVTGLTVQPRDSSGLGEAIRYLFEHPAQRIAFGKAARQRAIAEFDATVMARRVLGIYRTVCGLPAIDRQVLELDVATV